MPSLRLNDLLAWTGGQLLAGQSSGPDRVFAGISTDTRTIQPDSLFLALRGQNHDGHQFLSQALAAGASGLLISDGEALKDLHCPPADPDRPFVVILADDTLKALQAVAAGYRRTLGARVVGITGSVGKTSTRQMISACLQPALSIHQTAGNQNNEIGLPQTLLQAEPQHQAIVLEMGMRAPSEISLLSRVAQPDIAVLTCIGYSHIGRMGSQAAILAAKTEILDGLRPGGLLILNGDDPLLRDWGIKKAGNLRLAWITADAELAEALAGYPADFVLCAGQMRLSPDRSEFAANLFSDGQWSAIPVSLPFPGAHHIRNALFGLAVAHALHIDLRTAASGAAACRNTGNRQRIIEAGGVMIMDDSYNAGPESMNAALRTLADLAGGRRLLAALGGMLELGDFAPAAHRELGRQAAAYGFSHLWVIGPQSPDILAGVREISPDLPVDEFADNHSLAAALTAALQPDDCLLVKGSRVFAMEQVTAAVLEHLQPETTGKGGGHDHVD